MLSSGPGPIIVTPHSISWAHPFHLVQGTFAQLRRLANAAAEKGPNHRISQARELGTQETERAERSPPGLVLADCVAKVFLDHSTNFPSFLARRSNAAARPH